MAFEKITTDELNRHLAEVADHYTLVGPVASGHQIKFDTIQNCDDLRLTYTTTVLPPKKQFLPQIETVLTFSKEEGYAAPAADDTKPTALLGVHSCDLAAINVIDRIFADGPRDPQYAERRKEAVIAAVRCMTPCDNHAFCNVMQTIDNKEGADLYLTPLDGLFLVEQLTDKGRAFLAAAKLEPAEDEWVQAALAQIAERDRAFRSDEPIDLAELAEAMTGSEDDPIWAELADDCLACGSCNSTCPTCYCFDMCDKMEMNLSDGHRERTWDSCQLREFAEVAGGENFREHRADRQRHRFYRKGKYLFNRFGLTGCVGCGRCVRQCLAEIDPLDVYQRLLKRRPTGV